MGTDTRADSTSVFKLMQIRSNLGLHTDVNYCEG